MPDDLLGRTLAGRYRVLRPIGQGGMGAVFEAIDVERDAKVAVKVLLATEPKAIARFRQEAEVCARLRSPHVVRQLAFVEPPDGAPFLVLELLEGTSLGRLLAREGKLPVERAVAIAVQMLEALAEAHALGIVHRDIKPSNVFVLASSGTDVVKVLDFGIAKLAEGGVKTTTGAILGTPSYLAPEQILGKWPVGPATDLHAVGLVLHEMIAGEKPFATKDIAAAIAFEPPRRLEGAPPHVAAVVARALAKEPSARFPSAEAMMSALRGDAPPSPRAVPKDATPARSFAVAFGATVVVVAAGAALFALGRLSAPASPPTASTPPPAPPPPAPPPSSSASAAPPEEDAAAPLSAPADAGPSRRPALDGDCLCAWKLSNNFSTMICQARQTPQCSCRTEDVGSELCGSPKASDGTCAGGEQTFGGPGKQEGQPCSGYRRIDGKDVLLSGTLHCNFCYEQRGVAAVHGTPCTGFTQRGEVASGEWLCRKRRR